MHGIAGDGVAECRTRRSGDAASGAMGDGMIVGDVIDQYRITERLGGGGMGEVYRALDVQLDRHVALKSVRPELSDLEDVAQRFRVEARTLAKLSHPNIATVYRFFQHDDQLILVMEFIDGQPFGRLMARPLAHAEVVELVCQALDGLGYSHQHGVVHRDIKPGNLMLNRQGIVKVVDFGIAHLIDGTRLTRTGSSIGTPAYMAPEQVLGQAVDGRSDLYSLGVVLYEMISGQLPFEGDSDFETMRAHLDKEPRPLADLVNGIPDALQECVSRALARDSGERFATAREFSQALRSAAGAERPGRKAGADSQTLRAADPTESLTAERPATGKRAKTWVWAAVAGFIALAAGAGMWLSDAGSLFRGPAAEATSGAIAGQESGTSVVVAAEVVPQQDGTEVVDESALPAAIVTAGVEAPAAAAAPADADSSAGDDTRGGASALTNVAMETALPSIRSDVAPVARNIDALPGPPTLAVLPFTASQPSSYAESLAQAVGNELVNSGSFQVLERARLGAVLNEVEFQRSGGFVAPENAVQTGRTLGARVLITGHVLDSGRESQKYSGYGITTTKTTYRLQARLDALDVETGAKLFSRVDEVSAEAQSVQGSRVDSTQQNLAPQLARKLVGALLASGSVRALTERSEVISFEVIAEPPTADVEIDGTYYGSAGGSFELSPGFHEVKVTSAGYLDWSKRVLVRQGARVVARLQPDDTARTFNESVIRLE